MTKLADHVTRSIRENRVTIGVGLLAIVVGLTAGGLINRQPVGSIEITAVDPNTGCGSVSLALVSHWLGHPTTMEDLNVLTHSYATGTSSLLDLKEAAQTIGLTAETVQLDGRRLPQWRLPTILHINDNHFVAVLPIDELYVVFADPPALPRIVDRRELARVWKGVALVIADTDVDLAQALARAGLQK
jgi:ABC-type bacteriocin/lantibiotic exporter with double-glycine peptidase domain